MRAYYLRGLRIANYPRALATQIGPLSDEHVKYTCAPRTAREDHLSVNGRLKVWNSGGSFCGGVIVNLQMKWNGSLNHFFQSDPRYFVFGWIDVDARTRATLQLL